MMIDIELYDPVTGRAGVYQDDYAWDEDEGPIYQWTDGNFGCDCNRSLFLAYSLGYSFHDEWPDGLELDCNTGMEDPRIKIEIREHGTGRLIYADMPHVDRFVCFLPKHN